MNPVEDLDALFFDLDGTLLQVEMQRFIPAYLNDLANQFCDYVPRDRFTHVARQAVHMLLARGDAQQTNRQRYLAVIERQLNIPPEHFEERLSSWLEEGLPRLIGYVSPIETARPLLDGCFELGIPIVLATNPVFPAPMIEARLEWAGLTGYPFAKITSYENTRYCKPQPDYFRELVMALGVFPQRCLMVGNDTEHDLAASALGIKTYLADTYLVDRKGEGFSSDYRGSLTELAELLAIPL